MCVFEYLPLAMSRTIRKASLRKRHLVLKKEKNRERGSNMPQRQEGRKGKAHKAEVLT